MRYLSLVFIVFVSVFGISCKDYGPPSVGKGYKIEDLRGANSLTDSTNKCLIHSNVIQYSFDSTYILAMQKPWIEFINEPENIELSLGDKDSKYKKSQHKLYWVINKKVVSTYIKEEPGLSNLYGPFNKKSFLLKCKKLAVSDSLVLALFSAQELL